SPPPRRTCSSRCRGCLGRTRRRNEDRRCRVGKRACRDSHVAGGLTRVCPRGGISRFDRVGKIAFDPASIFATVEPALLPTLPLEDGVAVYTDVAAEDLASFLAGYDVGQLLSYKGIAEGVENSNFLVHTGRGHFILTLYEKGVAAKDLPFFLGL